MRDIWSFLLQTLTASGAAALLLAVKVMFRDKLSPRWQFAVWGVLGVMLLIPAGLGGRYSLFNWPLLVEVVKSGLTGEFGTLTRVAAPIPLPPLMAPAGAADWLYLIYTAGVIAFLARYVISYVRLRRALNKGRQVRSARVKAVAEEYGLPLCPVIVVDGLSTAFICGVFRPVLVLPSGVETDDKVILHELLHLKHKDVVWGWVIALFRCVHWCNPLLWLCADWAGNDLESLCDQRVLERLEGEDRRDYGRILLSMADEKYARAPGTSSASNGGENVRRRIEAIARFKRYPAGMGLASVCVALVLAVPMVVGAKAEGLSVSGNARLEALDYAMASARTVYCTTYAGAFDAYGKALLDGNLLYRAMCAPLSEQNELAALYREKGTSYWHWADTGIPGFPDDFQEGYRVYNLAQVGENAWEGLMAIRIANPDAPWNQRDYIWLAVQPLRVEKEGDRWVVTALEDFRAVYAEGCVSLPNGGCEQLPAVVYEAQAGDFTIRVRRQNSAYVKSYIQNNNGFWSTSSYDYTPDPDGEFNTMTYYHWSVDYTGDPADKADYTHLGLFGAPLWGDQERPELGSPSLGNGSSYSSNGESGISHPLKEDWNDHISLGGGGTGGYGEMDPVPDRYAVDLYLNRELAAELTLLPVEGGAWIDD